MDFEKKLDKIFDDHCINQSQVYRKLGIPQSTFLFKKKSLNAWRVPEFMRLVRLLKLTDEEFNFLTQEVE